VSGIKKIFYYTCLVFKNTQLNIADRLSLLIKDKRVGVILLSVLTIVAVSFFRAFVAGTIRVDLYGLSGIPVYVVFLGFLAGLTGYSVYYYRLWVANDLDIDSVRIVAVVLSAVFSLMMPMLSNDLYSLLTYGDAANRGIDVYTDIHSLNVSPYFDYVSILWKTAPCVYGPVSLGTARIASMIGDGNFILTIAAYKVIAFIWSLVLIQMAYRITVFLKLSTRVFLFIVLNPIFLLQGVGQLHCDMLAVTLCLCMLYFFMRGNWYLAFLFAGFTIAAKMNFVLVMAFLIVGLFLKKESWMLFLYRAGAGIFVTLTVLFVLYYPYYTSPDTFRVPLNFLFGQNPAKSIPEVLGDVVYFAPLVIMGHRDELHTTLTSSSGLFDGQLAAWLHVKMICQLFAILMCAIIFIRFWLGSRDSKKWMNIFLRFLLLFLLFYSHVFYAWYLMMLLPFVWFEEDKKFMQWMFVLTCFSNVHDIMCAINKATPVYFIVIPLTFLSVMVFFWRLRNNFLTSLNEAV
jgi:hypothetical protein